MMTLCRRYVLYIWPQKPNVSENICSHYYITSINALNYAKSITIIVSMINFVLNSAARNTPSPSNQTSQKETNLSRKCLVSFINPLAILGYLGFEKCINCEWILKYIFYNIFNILFFSIFLKY